MTSFLGTDPWKSEGRMGDLLSYRHCFFFTSTTSAGFFFQGMLPCAHFWGAGGKNWRAKCSAALNLDTHHKPNPGIVSLLIFKNIKFSRGNHQPIVPPRKQ